jgi:hypothetical protein
MSTRRTIKMNKMSRHFLNALVIVSLLGMTAMDASAGDKKRRGTAGASQLLVPLTARSASLGATLTSGMAGLNGLEAVYANPAGLALNTGTSALFSRMEYVAGIGVNYFGVGQSFGSNHIAFMVSSWDFGNIPKQTEIEPERSSVTFDASFVTAGLTYARQFTDRISAGATIKVISESIDDVNASAFAFDAGMTYVVGESGLRMGVSLKNVGSQMQYSGVGLTTQVRLPSQTTIAASNAVLIESEGVELPSLLNFGLSYTSDVGEGAVLTVLGNFRSNSFDQDQYSGGVELALFDVLYLRGGLEIVNDTDLSFFNGGSFGAGLDLNLSGTRVQIDYAYRGTDFFDNVNMFTVGVQL